MFLYPQNGLSIFYLEFLHRAAFAVNLVKAELNIESLFYIKSIPYAHFLQHVQIKTSPLFDSVSRRSPTNFTRATYHRDNRREDVRTASFTVEAERVICLSVRCVVDSWHFGRSVRVTRRRPCWVCMGIAMTRLVLAVTLGCKTGSITASYGVVAQHAKPPIVSESTNQ